MVLPTEISCAVSGIMSVMVFTAMQLAKDYLGSTELWTIFGGFLGSLLFILLLTFINNVENLTFERGFEASVLPEVGFALTAAVFSSGLVHRVCATTSFIFSLIALYYINRLSSKKYGTPQGQVYMSQASKNKRKN